MSPGGHRLHALSVDVEDWNNVTLLAKFGRVVPPTTAVVRNTERLLGLFQEHQARATWFVLGEVAETYPGLVKRLAEAGEELGVHGYHHHNVFDLTREEFRSYTVRAKERVEQLAGRPVLGYRATSFSITKKVWWAFEVLAELGFRYDSSVFPIRGRRYGIPDAPLLPYPLATPAGPLTEVPPSVMDFGRLRLPCCGGGYLRHFPLAYTRFAMGLLQRRGRAAVFYLHPYELDTTFDEKFFAFHAGADWGRGWSSWRFMQYRNRRTVLPKLRWLLGQFQFESIASACMGA